MKGFSILLDWSTQASQAVHGKLISRGGKQELPLQIGQEKPPPSGLKTIGLQMRSGIASCVCQYQSSGI